MLHAFLIAVGVLRCGLVLLVPVLAAVFAGSTDQGLDAAVATAAFKDLFGQGMCAYAGLGLMVALYTLSALVVLEPQLTSGPVEQGAAHTAAGLFLIVYLALAFEFAIIMFLAIHNRLNPEFHKRLILLALVPLLPPALSRWPVVPGPPLFTCDLAIIAGCAYDKFSRGRLHAVWRWSLPLMLVGGVLTIFVALQPVSQRFADRIDGSHRVFSNVRYARWPHQEPVSRLTTQPGHSCILQQRPLLVRQGNPPSDRDERIVLKKAVMADARRSCPERASNFACNLNG